MMRVLGLICLAALAAGEVDPLLGADPALGEPVEIDIEKNHACTACLAVSWELGALLSSEKSAPSFLMGMGKVKDWKVSELRTTEILENLCPLMKGYALYKRSDKDVKQFRRIDQEEGLGAHARSHAISSHLLRIYCDKLVEKYEEQFEKLIMSGYGITDGDMEALGYAVCKFQVHACKDINEVKEYLPMTPEYLEIKRQRMKLLKGSAKDVKDASDAKDEDAKDAKDKDAKDTPQQPEEDL